MNEILTFIKAHQRKGSKVMQVYSTMKLDRLGGNNQVSVIKRIEDDSVSFKNEKVACLGKPI